MPIRSVRARGASPRSQCPHGRKAGRPSTSTIAPSASSRSTSAGYPGMMLSSAASASTRSHATAACAAAIDTCTGAPASAATTRASYVSPGRSSSHPRPALAFGCSTISEPRSTAGSGVPTSIE